MKLNKLSFNLLIYLCFFLVVFFLYQSYNSMEFYYDTLKAISANQNPDSYSISYWWQIFTTPIHGKQYRPLSLFAYFFWMREIFGTNILAYRILSHLILSSVGFFSFLFIKRYTNTIFAFISVLILFTHSLFEFLMYELSHTLKYFLPLILLFCSLSLIEIKGVSKKTILILFSFLTLSLLCHEASFTFVGIILVYLIFMKNEIFRKEYLLLLIPSFCWGIARTFIWKLPQSGTTFSLGKFEYFFHKVIYYFYSVFAFVIQDISDHGRDFNNQIFLKEIFLFIFLLGIALFFYFKKKDKFLLFCFSSCLILILPFSLLSTHVWANRGIWLVPFAISFYSYLVFYFYKNSYQKFSILLGLTLFSSSLYFYHPEDRFKTSEHPKVIGLENTIQAQIKEHIQNDFLSFEISENFEKNFGGFTSHAVMPGIMALQFPHAEIHLHYQYLSPIFGTNSLIIVKDGSYYIVRSYKDNQFNVIDPFQVQSIKQFNPLSPEASRVKLIP